MEWGSAPYPSYLKLTNKTPLALMDVEASIIDIKKRVGGVFIQTLHWLPPMGPIRLQKEGGIPALVHNEFLMFEVLRGHMTDPNYWHLGVGDQMTIGAGDWEFTVKCTWRDQTEPFVKTFRFGFTARGRPQILP